jgi:hypothetical protein
MKTETARQGQNETHFQSGEHNICSTKFCYTNFKQVITTVVIPTSNKL